MDNILLLLVTYFIVGVILLVGTLVTMQNLKRKKYQKELEELNRNKNMLGNIPIPQELSRVETILKNEELTEKYSYWNEKYKNIKESRIPEISKMIIDADYLMEQKDYKNLVYKIVKIELEIYKVDERANTLLNQIKAITLSEEKNREVITNLKAKYRELNYIYKQKKEEYGETANSIELQFENIEKRFLEFEKNMENNNYVEVGHIIKALTEMIEHMNVVIEEIPNIVLLSKVLIPKKIQEITIEYNKMLNMHYPLEYLNFEFNVKESIKKINDVLDRIKVLNLEDALLELKTIFEYFDSMFNDFEAEKLNRRLYQENIRSFRFKLKDINELTKKIYDQIEDLKNNYDLNDAKIDELDTLNKKLLQVNIGYKDLEAEGKKATVSYSQLSITLDGLTTSLGEVEEQLGEYLSNIGTMKEDEQRAREQLEEIKLLLKNAKLRIRKTKLPVIQKEYFVELKEASLAIGYINTELAKTPINIKNLNMRVDTARDLAFKVFNRTNEMIKTALMAETAIVYGNRYRSSNPGVEQGLNNAEVMFLKGSYKNSLGTIINALDLVEPGIYDRILKDFKNRIV